MTGVKMAVYGSATLTVLLSWAITVMAQVEQLGEAATEVVRQTGGSQPALLLFVVVVAIGAFLIVYLFKHLETVQRMHSEQMTSIIESHDLVVKDNTTAFEEQRETLQEIHAILRERSRRD